MIRKNKIITILSKLWLSFGLLCLIEAVFIFLWILFSDLSNTHIFLLFILFIVTILLLLISIVSIGESFSIHNIKKQVITKGLNILYLFLFWCVFPYPFLLSSFGMQINFSLTKLTWKLIPWVLPIFLLILDIILIIFMTRPKVTELIKQHNE